MTESFRVRATKRRRGHGARKYKDTSHNRVSVGGWCREARYRESRGPPRGIRFFAVRFVISVPALVLRSRETDHKLLYPDHVYLLTKSHKPARGCAGCQPPPHRCGNTWTRPRTQALQTDDLTTIYHTAQICDKNVRRNSYTITQLHSPIEVQLTERVRCKQLGLDDREMAPRQTRGAMMKPLKRLPGSGMPPPALVAGYGTAQQRLRTWATRHTSTTPLALSFALSAR